MVSLLLYVIYFLLKSNLLWKKSRTLLNGGTVPCSLYPKYNWMADKASLLC